MTYKPKAFVYVIESPSDIDLLDGRTEGRSLCEALKLAEIPHAYTLITTKNALKVSLKERLIETLEKYPNQSPVLHLSMHGNNEGISLTDTAFIKWSELREILAPLTNGMEGGLLICMSSCNGSAGLSMAMHEDKDHPFWALVGNTQTTVWADAAIAYITFYHWFFKGGTVKECVERMRAASGDENFISQYGQSIKQDWAAFMAATRRQVLIAALRS